MVLTIVGDLYTVSLFLSFQIEFSIVNKIIQKQTCKLDYSDRISMQYNRKQLKKKIIDYAHICWRRNIYSMFTHTNINTPIYVRVHMFSDAYLSNRFSKGTRTK